MRLVRVQPPAGPDAGPLAMGPGIRLEERLVGNDWTRIVMFGELWGDRSSGSAKLTCHSDRLALATLPA